VPRGLFEWAVVATAIAVVVANVGAYVTRDGGGVPEQHVLAAAKKVSQPPTSSVWEPQPPPPPPASVFEPPASKARAATFAFVAARGDSWLSVHERSFRGRVLYEGLLREGERVRVRSRRLWVRFGGAADFDVFMNGRRATLPLFGTYDAFVTPSGIRRDAAVHVTQAQSP
jgi:hypothetical protein